ncbi:hypothetical protein K0040_15530 [Terrisporobacter petrolearius]|uniref:hypothetical protein n=1 Tax=Terrisporobacter petrolearius TaxID=1460447 RepID=UPI001D166A50|nr:hypothetical protein [Terrisporobacter petrolearius]MCC3865674.1 hypothetical protein [Terrisporobacter petrolearius]
MSEKLEEIKKCLRDASVEEIGLYDTKNEFEDILKINSDDSDLKRIIIYKMKANSLGIDCDVSLRSVFIYTLVFDFLGTEELINKQSSKYKYQINKNKEYDKGVEIYFGDTMTSFWTTLKAYIQENAPKGDIRKQTGEFLLDINGYVPKEQRKMGWYSYIKKNMKEFEALLSDECKEFLRLNHTMANFIPVPEKFNINRSANPNGKKRINAEWDYWDLTLKSIYNYYNPKNSDNESETGNGYKALEFLLKTTKDTEIFAKCKEWLDSFESWNEFIIKNYLQDFVYMEIDNEGNDICKEPIMFWENHSFANPLPKGDQFNEFFTNVTRMIKLRGLRIGNKAKSVLKEK